MNDYYAIKVKHSLLEAEDDKKEIKSTNLFKFKKDDF